MEGIRGNPLIEVVWKLLHILYRMWGCKGVGLRERLTNLMAVVKPSRTGCEAAASGALYCAADNAFKIASPLTCQSHTCCNIKLARPCMDSTRTNFACKEKREAASVWLALYT